MGDPREPTDPRIIAALKDGVRERMGYPAAVGLAGAARGDRAGRPGVSGSTLDPDAHVIPTLGSKEAIFTFAPVVARPRGGQGHGRRHRARVPGARAWRAVRRRAASLELPLLEEHAFLPDLDALDLRLEARAALVWVNYPNNPTGATAPLAFYERLAALAREHGFVLASDEAYTELWSDEPPVSALQLADWTNLVVFNTLSKRSSMTGFRCGFVAGDPALVDALKQFRPNVGTAPQEFVQRASVVAWARREARRTRTRVVRPQAQPLRSTSSRARGSASRAAARRCTSGSPCPSGETSESSRPGCSSTACSSRPARTSARRARATRGFALVPDADRSAQRAVDDPGETVYADDRGTRSRAIEELWDAGQVDAAPVEEAVRLLDAGEIRVAEPRGDDWVVNEWVEEGDPPLLPAAQGRADGGRRAPLPRQDPGEVRLRRARRAGRAARRRALRRPSSPRASC